jgi:hypothetical protein
MQRALLWFAAVLAAAVGVWLYARDPRGLTYFAHALLCLPLFTLVIETAARVLPERVQWAIAIPLALLGPLSYLIWMDNQTWLYGALAAMPLVLLAERRAERRGESAGHTSGADFWSPP